MSEPIPQGWKKEPLRNLAQVVSGGTPSRYAPEFWDRGTIPWVTPTDITGSNGRYLSETREHITELGLHSCSAKLLPVGSLLMTSRATLGEVRIAVGEVCTNQGFKSLIPFKGVDGRFLFYQIGLNKERYKGLGIGSTFLEVNKHDTERFEVLVAPEREQRRIAEILLTLDEAIEQTEALIAKHQQIKAGLMHDLFTRGVTPDGHLRPTREQAPDLYKESPLGWIPKEWKCRPCSQICERITVGIVIRPTQYYVKHGVPAFRSANVRETGIDPSDFVFISQEANNLLAKSQVRAGDILTVRTGYPGTSAVVPDEFSGANAIDILLSRPTSEVNSFFLCYWINSSFGKGHVLRTQGGLAQQHFNVGELRDLLVALPKPDEQRAITERLDSMSQHIRCEESVLAKWMKQKHGIMHDLLTGCVRVNV